MLHGGTCYEPQPSGPSLRRPRPWSRGVPWGCSRSSSRHRSRRIRP
jgi:hypothetical protein